MSSVNIPDMQTTGTDLKVERVKANLQIQDVAARMGISRQAVWGIERAAVVAPDRAARYRKALVTSGDIDSIEATA